MLRYRHEKQRNQRTAFPAQETMINLPPRTAQTLSTDKPTTT
ncbi:MAG: hypothetical protein R3E89_05925 [Thiolinea sp.]